MKNIAERLVIPLNLIGAAMLDYRYARGGEHKALLFESRKRLLKERGQLRQKKQRLNKQLNELWIEYKKTQMLLLEKYIAENAFMDIESISEDLWKKIYPVLFRGRLNDLLKIRVSASISVEQQRDLKTFVNYYTYQMNHLLTMDFPGKQEAANRYIQSKQRLIDQVAEINWRLFIVERNIDRCKLAIFQLKKATLWHFIFFALGHQSSGTTVNAYLYGLFGEWDPIPCWFKELITSSEDRDAFQAS